MKPGAVLVDVAIDQGGCFETSKATTHDDPIYMVDGIVHYCVANMPGAVARTATIALGNATMPFMLALADKGWQKACSDNPHLMAGLNTHAGHLTYDAVGMAQGIKTITPARGVGDLNLGDYPRKTAPVAALTFFTTAALMASKSASVKLPSLG